MKSILTILTLALVGSNVSFAAETFDVRQLTLDKTSVVVTEVSMPTRGPGDDGEQVDPQIPPTTNNGGTPTIPPPDSLPTPSLPQVPPINQPGTPGQGGNGGVNWDDINQGIDIADKIVNLVDKIFEIIAKNQPVVNITVNYANAVPYGLSHWTQLQGWSTPKVKRYNMSFKNALGAKVVDVTYQIHWTYGGNYEGKGKYLTGVTVEPISVKTAWGYNVDLTAQVPDSTIANVGTSEDPIASMQVQLNWKVHSMVSDMTGKDIYYVQGDGKMQPLTTRNSTNAKDIERATKTIKNVKF